MSTAPAAASQIVFAFLWLATPVAAAALLFRLFRRASGSRAQGLLLALIVFEVVVVVQVETLSLFALYRPWPVTVSWGLVAAAAAATYGRVPERVSSFARPDRWEGAVLTAAAALLAGTLFTAMLGAPNTWDALTYHLPRAMHWVQNASIEHYPTSIARQLKMPPLAEMLVSQTVLLSGADRLVNLVQWTAYAATGVAISTFVRASGSPRLAGWSGALLFFSLPMAILQASGPKNDLVLCANLTASIAFFQIGFGELRRPWMTAGAAALGLAVLTKGTALVFGFVVAALVVGTVARRHGMRRGFEVAAVLTLCVTAINAGHWGRNLRQFGSPLGPTHEGHGYEYRNQRIDAGVIASNLMRNLALHLETPSVALNRAIEARIVAAHNGFGLAMDDPETTWPDAKLRLARFPSRDEDRSGNPLHLLAFVTALAASPWLLRRAPHARLAGLLAGGLILGALGFCVLFKWQEWHSRLHLPLFVAGSILVPLVGWRRGRSVAIVAMLLAATSVPVLLANSARPLVGAKSIWHQSRWENLLRGQSSDGRRLAERLSELGATEIGVRLGGHDTEYLIWAIARKAVPRARLHHVAATNEVASYVVPPLDANVAYGDSAAPRRLRIDGRTYRIDCRCGAFALWKVERPRRR